jgi:ATP-dependent DNA ligase
VSKQLPILYVKTSSGQINYWQIWTEGAVVRTQWGKLGSDKPLSEKYTAAGKNIGRANETSPEIQAEIEAEAKYKKQIRLKYVDSVAKAEGNLNIKPMRAYALDDKRRLRLQYPFHMQPKFNGVRCMAYNLPDGAVRLMSRGGKDYNLRHVQVELQGIIPQGWCLDGELYVHGMQLQNIRKLIQTYCMESLQVCFHAYDMTRLPPDETPWVTRYTHLVNFCQSREFTFLKLSPTVQAEEPDDIDKYHDRFVSEGYEGAIIRVLNGTYKLAAKNVDLLKVKRFHDAEFKVVGWRLGKDGKILYQCVQEEGLPFDVTPMGTDEEKGEMLKTADRDIGKLMTVKFQERSVDNIPLITTGLGFRGAEDLD